MKMFLALIPALMATQVAFGSEVIPLAHCNWNHVAMDYAVSVDVHMIRGVARESGPVQYLEGILTVTTMAGTRSYSFQPLQDSSQPIYDTPIVYQGEGFTLTIGNGMVGPKLPSHVSAEIGTSRSFEEDLTCTLYRNNLKN